MGCTVTPYSPDEALWFVKWEEFSFIVRMVVSSSLQRGGKTGPPFSCDASEDLIHVEDIASISSGRVTYERLRIVLWYLAFWSLATVKLYIHV